METVSALNLWSNTTGNLKNLLGAAVCPPACNNEYTDLAETTSDGNPCQAADYAMEFYKNNGIIAGQYVSDLRFLANKC